MVNRTAWFDCFQLEQGDSANAFNMVNSAGFERTLSGTAPQAWDMFYTTEGDGRAGQSRMDSYSAVLSGGYGTRKFYRQTINVSGGEGDIYSLSGWAKAAAIPGEEFRICAEVKYSNGSSGWKLFDFDPYITDWQYVCGIFSTDDIEVLKILAAVAVIVIGEVVAYNVYNKVCGNNTSINTGNIINDTKETIQELPKLAVVAAATKIYEYQVEKQAEELSSIAGQYDVFECDIAAEAMKAKLQKKKQHGNLIIMKFSGENDYNNIWSESKIWLLVKPVSIVV